MQKRISRRYPIGAELVGPNQTHFRLWAPKAKRVDVVLETSAAKNAQRTFHPLHREEGGYFSGSAPAPQKPLTSNQINLVANLVADPSAARPALSGLAPVSAGDDARSVRTEIHGQ